MEQPWTVRSTAYRGEEPLHIWMRSPLGHEVVAVEDEPINTCREECCVIDWVSAVQTAQEQGFDCKKGVTW